MAESYFPLNDSQKVRVNRIMDLLEAFRDGPDLAEVRKNPHNVQKQVLQRLVEVLQILLELVSCGWQLALVMPEEAEDEETTPKAD